MKLITLALGLSLFPASLVLAASQTGQLQQDSTASVSTTLQALEEAQSKKNAQEWGLTVEEWQRYQALNKGRRGVLSPGLDPITTLGIEARTAEERRRYAELSVKQDFQRVESELAFQHEVNAAWQRIYPDILPVQATGRSFAQGNGRLALFVRADCAPCEPKVATLLAGQRPLDIYLVGSDGKDEVVRPGQKNWRYPPIAFRRKPSRSTMTGGNGLSSGRDVCPLCCNREKADGKLPHFRRHDADHRQPTQSGRRRATANPTGILSGCYAGAGTRRGAVQPGADRVVEETSPRYQALAVDS